jgi:hypothetical protein
MAPLKAQKSVGASSNWWLWLCHAVAVSENGGNSRLKHGKMVIYSGFIGIYSDFIGI